MEPSASDIVLARAYLNQARQMTPNTVGQFERELARLKAYKAAYTELNGDIDARQNDCDDGLTSDDRPGAIELWESASKQMDALRKVIDSLDPAIEILEEGIALGKKSMQDWDSKRIEEGYTASMGTVEQVKAYAKVRQENEKLWPELGVPLFVG